jgi:hypothetical protein
MNLSKEVMKRREEKGGIHFTIVAGSSSSKNRGCASLVTMELQTSKAKQCLLQLLMA